MGNKTQEEDDDWFDEEDDTEELVKKGIIDRSFLQFLSEGIDDSDKQSVASWGTGDTAYFFFRSQNKRPTHI